MSRKKYDDDYEYEYEYEGEAEDDEEYEAEEKSGGSKGLFLVILGVLLLALTVLCVLLTGKLRSANTEVESLQSKLKEAETVKWTMHQETPGSAVPSETVPIPAPASSTPPAPVSEPTPAPTPTPAPAVVTAGGLPSWLTEENMAKITRRPKDDEWYGSPGKLYVTATLGLNLRTGIRTDIDNIITQIKCGSEVMVYAASGNMRFVQDPKGNFGWASSKLMSNEPPKGVTVIPFATVAVSSPTPVSTDAPVSTPASGDSVPVPEAPTING